MSEIDAITRVVKVTVSEDRAHVLRAGAVALPAGMATVRVRGVAPVLADKTLRIDAGAAKVAAVAVERRVRALPPDGNGSEPDALAARILASERALGSLDRAIDHAATRAALASGARASTLDDLAVDAAHGRAPEDAPLMLASFDEDERQARADRVRLAASRRDALRDLNDLRARHAALGARDEVREADVVVSLVCEAPCEITLELSYLVPGACWRPQHTATRGARVRVSTEACVWQNTGEPWSDVELRFSTERPSLGHEPPSLAADVLATQRKSDVVQVEQRDDEIQTAGLGTGPAMKATKLPGIDDGGEVRVLPASSRATVPSDGQPYLVPTGAFETESAVGLVCIPEFERAVIVRSVQSNGPKAPLLAGPVTLIGEGGVIGRTSVSFLSPGERFELGWGPDPNLRVQRNETRAPLTPGLLAPATVGRTHHVQVFVSNLGDEPRSFEIVERLPVSELAKVTVDFDAKATRPPARPDNDGFVRWHVTVPPRGRTQVELVYVLRHARDVVGL